MSKPRRSSGSHCRRSILFSLVTAVVLSVVGASILAFFDASALAPYVLLLALGQFGGGAVSALTGWAIQTRSFTDIATMRVTQSAVLVAVQLTLGVARLGAPGLLLGDVAGRFGGRSASPAAPGGPTRMPFGGSASAACAGPREATVASRSTRAGPESR